MALALGLISTILLGFYFFSALQYSSYYVSRVFWHFSKPSWHLRYMLLPYIVYVALLWRVDGVVLGIYAIWHSMWIYAWWRKLDKRLVFTARIKRTFVFLLVAAAMISWWIIAQSAETVATAAQNTEAIATAATITQSTLSSAQNAATTIQSAATADQSTTFALTTSEILLILLPVLAIALATILSSALERVIAGHYYHKARARILSHQCRVILITASYGKTSTKNYLSQLLSAAYRTYAPTGSINTLNGIIKDINTALPDDCEYYIVEAGARGVDDILDISRLVQPHICIVGQIGSAHLEYFKDIATTRQTKLKALRSKRLQGYLLHSSTLALDFLAANSDKTSASNGATSEISFVGKTAAGATTNEICKTSASNANTTGTANTASTANTATNEILPSQAKNLCDTYYDDGVVVLDSSLDGVRFSIDGAEFATNILGAFSAQNLAACVRLAKHLGMDTSAILRRLSSLKPVAHRLERIDSGGKIILDDSFNGNLDGMSASYEICKSHKGRKIIITPGIVEVDEATNIALCAKINATFDLAILTSSLNQKTFERHITIDKVFLHDKSQLVDLLAKRTSAGDLIIFSNDAPSYV